MTEPLVRTRSINTRDLRMDDYLIDFDEGVVPLHSCKGSLSMIPVPSVKVGLARKRFYHGEFKVVSLFQTMNSLLAYDLIDKDKLHVVHKKG